MQTEPRARFYHPELDGLRFFAFLLVFIHNAPYYSTSSLWTSLHDNGWIGVDLFFCLSAFLITKLLLTEYEQEGRIDIRSFYIRRILRIWPLYYFFVSLVVLFTIKDQGWSLEILQRSVGTVTFIDNFGAALWGFSNLAFSIHLWTISYEWQFYAIIPWTLKAMSKTSQTTQMLIFASIFLAGSLFRALLIHYRVRYPAIYVLPFTHFEAILGGLMMGSGLIDNLLHRINKWIILFVSMAAFVLVVELPNKQIVGWHLMFIYTLTGIGMTLTLYLTMKVKDTIYTNPLKSRVLVYLGKISYGLYIYHIPSFIIVYYICRQIGVTPQQSLQYPLIVLSLGMILSITLSYISYNFLERPFLSLKEKFASVQSRPT